MTAPQPRRVWGSPRGRMLATAVAVVLAGIGIWTYVAYESYPFSWPKARVMAGQEYEVVLHSLTATGDVMIAEVTVRRQATASIPYFGYWGAQVHLPSGETLPTEMSIYGENRWLERLKRSAIRLSFPSLGPSGTGTLLLRFFVEGRALECSLPLRVPGD